MTKTQGFPITKTESAIINLLLRIAQGTFTLADAGRARNLLNAHETNEADVYNFVIARVTEQIATLKTTPPLPPAHTPPAIIERAAALKAHVAYLKHLKRLGAAV